jgi:hypothetical protein
MIKPAVARRLNWHRKGRTMADLRNIFISHVHEDDHRLQPLKELLQRAGLEVRDGSINSDKPNDAKDEEYIKHEIIAPRVRWASALVVLVSPDTCDSWWVNWEIEYAQKQGKRIVGVWDHGEADCDLPDGLEQYADAVVGWQADRVIDAINGTINNFDPQAGAPPAARKIPRHSC